MRSVILFIFLWRCLAAQQAGIEGRVIDAVTRQPMPGVHISLRASDNVYGAISGRDGHFSIANMPPAVYVLSIQRNGYVHLPPKAPNGRADDSVTLKPGDQLTEFTVEMTPRAVITGTVVDEFGDPVQHVEVEALPAVSGSSESLTGPHSPARTDDRGQFRIPLPSGKFYVRAKANSRTTPLVKREIRSDGLEPPVYGATFYPGTESKDQATLVQLTAGREVTGIDIRLTRKHSLTISGVVTGMQDHSVPAGVSMFSSGDSFPRLVLTAPDGRFTAPGLPPGLYHLVARQTSAGTPLQSPTVDVRLDSADQSNVSLALVHSEALSGTLAIEGDPVEALTVLLDRYTEYGGLEAAGQLARGDVDRDGSFRINQVFPGKFRVRVLPMPENAYVKSVKLDDTEAPDGILDLSRGVEGARIKVTISRNGGRLEGSVLGDSPAVVVLAATMEAIDDTNPQIVEPGAKFKYTGLRPGKYRLIAIGGREFTGDESIKALFPKAPEIEIREGDRITKDVKPMTAENPSGTQ
jgi:hypothetical protein